MNKQLFLYAFLVITQQTFSMDSVAQSKIDHYSPLSLPVRKQIILPLIAQSKSCREIKEILLSLAFLSKKSYDQINCINFTKNVIETVVETLPFYRGAIASHINTKGMKQYKELSEGLFSALYSFKTMNKLSKKTPRFVRLLQSGADINYQMPNTGTTPLMKAVELCNTELVVSLIKRGAHVNDCNNKGYPRDYSILFTRVNNEDRSMRYLSFLVKHFKRLKKDYGKPEAFLILYLHSMSTTIRNAIAIDTYLQSAGGLTHIKVMDNILSAHDTINGSRIILNIITDNENNPYNQPYKEDVKEEIKIITGTSSDCLSLMASGFPSEDSCSSHQELDIA